MIMIALCSVIFMFFIFFDLLPLLSEKLWKEFWIYSALISSSYVIHILLALDYRLPSPAVPIKRLVQAIFGIQS